MMSGIILVGSLFIFFDTSIPIIIGGTVAFGIILIMGLGLLTIEDIKGIRVFGTRSKDHNKNGHTEKESSPSTRKKASKPKGERPFSGLRNRFRHDRGKETTSTGNSSGTSKRTDTPGEKSDIGAGLALAMGSLKARFIRSKDSSHGQKIDELLDSAIKEPVSSNQRLTAPEKEQPKEENVIPDIFSDEFDDDDFGILDDIELDDEIQASERIKPAEMNDDQDPARSPGNRFDDGMMSIEAILAGETSSGDEEKISPGQPGTGFPEGDEMEFGSIGDLDEIDVDGGILTLDDDLTKTPFSKSVEKFPSINAENDFSFGLPEDADPFGSKDPGYPEEEAFGAFSLDDLDLDSQGSLDDLELDIMEEEEEIDSVGLLPDDISSDGSHLRDGSAMKDTAVSKTDVMNFGGFGDSSPEEFMSFGGGDDDDLLSMLKSDMKSKKSIQDVSLVRNMKDTDVGVEELIAGLEDVLKKMGGKPSLQTNDQNREK